MLYTYGIVEKDIFFCHDEIKISKIIWSKNLK